MTRWDDDDPTEIVAPALTVDITEPQVLNRLYGPDGSVLLEFTDRAWVPFGFQPPDPTC